MLPRQTKEGAADVGSWSKGDLRRALAIAGIIAGGLAFDQLVDFWGQTLTNVGIWAALLYWMRGARADDQLALAVCVMYATLGEIFLSLVWGLYEYRLANVPLFVPPGHALLFMLGRLIAQHIDGWIEWVVPFAAAPFAYTAAYSFASQSAVRIALSTSSSRLKAAYASSFRAIASSTRCSHQRATAMPSSATPLSESASAASKASTAAGQSPPASASLPAVTGSLVAAVTTA